ncbi:glycosyltransferase family 4 protein [Candidatus Gottesmanbacteria bacterium]|nr:glycosyltransferase family 4 protein [Candidatus Gottesmanbacteria bacterium]
MHIAIDTTSLEGEHRDRGIGSYTGLLIEALQKYENKHSYSFFTRKQKVPKSADIVHYPYFDPFFLTLPLVKSKPVVVTVHDVIPLVYPEYFPSGVRGKVKWYIQRASLRGARRIITDSFASKQDIQKIVGVPDALIDTVYLAPGDIFRPINDKKELSSVQRKYQLPTQYLLYVGDVNWNKNVIGLLRAKPKGLKLVLVGKSFKSDALSETQRINALIHAIQADADIIRTGYVTDAELAAIYNLATAYIQPSFAEGFGLPVLEAFSSGCPVICARGSSLDEIAGPAIRVDASDQDAIFQGIKIAINISIGEREKLRQKQFTWVRQFTWRKTAGATVGAYEKAFGDSN